MSASTIKTDGTGNFIFSGIEDSTLLFGRSSNAVDERKSNQKFFPSTFPKHLPQFTGRETVFEDISASLAVHGSAALADIHGVGKTSTAVEYAYRNQSAFSKIFFLLGAKAEFDSSLSGIHAELGLNLVSEGSSINRLADFKGWLANNNGWLLIIDNVDNVGFFSDCGLIHPNGKVILTSNDASIFKIGAKVDFPPMTEEDSVLLLYKHWKGQADTTSVIISDQIRGKLHDIAMLFGNHPFAMEFVGSYLASELVSIDEFLSDYRNRQNRLLERYEFLTTYKFRNVANAFLLHFDEVTTSKDAGDEPLANAASAYLNLAAFLGPNDIPEELLENSLRNMLPRSGVPDNISLKVAQRFHRTSIFRRDPDLKTLSTHRIVQEVSRLQLDPKVERECFLALLTTFFETFEVHNYRNLLSVNRLLTHARAFIEIQKEHFPADAEDDAVKRSIAYLNAACAVALHDCGNLSQAEPHYCDSIDILEDIGDRKNMGPLYNNLGDIYFNLDNDAEAERCLQKAIEITSVEFAPDSREVASVYGNIGISHLDAGRIVLAEKHLKKAVAMLLNVDELEDYSENLANCYYHLSEIYRKRNQVAARDYYLNLSIRLFQSNFPDGHPKLGRNLHRSAQDSFAKRKFKEALDKLTRAKTNLTQFFPEDHYLIRSCNEGILALSKIERRSN